MARLAGLFGVSEDDPKRAARTILAGCLAYLARSAAQTVLVNLEDLLLERRPQNVPGTQSERPNWRRKIAVSLEELPRRSGSAGGGLALDLDSQEGQPGEQQHHGR